MWHDSLTYVTWPSHACDVTYSCVWCHQSSHLSCALTPSYVSEMTHLYVFSRPPPLPPPPIKHYSFESVTWLIYIYYLNHLNVWSDLFICVMPQVVSWGDCEMTWDGENIFYTWHDSSIYVMWLIHICDVTYLCVSCHSHLMRWLWDDVRWREHIVYMAYEAYDTAHARELKTTLYLICK